MEMYFAMAYFATMCVLILSKSYRNIYIYNNKKTLFD